MNSLRVWAKTTLSASRLRSVLPARSRRILSNASASDLLRRSRASSCVSSPMAKYASCWRAHAPQKATPRISTSARRRQGLSVLLRTWQVPNFVVSSGKRTLIRTLLDRLLEGVACAEGGDPRSRDLHLLAGLGIPSLPGLALLNGELVEARDLDLLASLERLGHHLFEGRKVPLGFTGGHVDFLGDHLGELLLLHYCSFLRLTWVDWRACLLLTFLFYGSRDRFPSPRFRRV